MRSRFWVGALLTLLVAALLLPAAAPAKNKPADTVFKNGYVYTVNPGARVASAVAVKDGRIVYVGSNQGANAFVGPVDQGRQARRQDDAAGLHRLAHARQHDRQQPLLGAALRHDERGRVRRRGRRVRRARNPDMDVIRGQGWSNTVVPDIGPLATDLDAVVSDRPVSIMSEDGHSYWVNSKALELAGITGTTPDPENGVIERLAGTEATDPPYGTPSGTLRETAANLVTDLLPDYTVQQYKDGIAYFQDEVAAPLGLTTVFDPLMYVGSNGVQALEEMAAAGDLTRALPRRPRADAGGRPRRRGSRPPRRSVPSTRTACSRRRPSRSSPTASSRATPPTSTSPTPTRSSTRATRPTAASRSGSPTQMKKTFAELDKAGFQIHTHAIGDAATTETLDALAYARKANGKHDWRPGITHIQLVDPKDFPRFAKLGVTAVPDPYWFIKDDYYTYLQVPYLGQPRADLEYPMKSFFDAGVTVASASDYPVTIPPDPLAGIAVGVNRWDPELRLRVPGAAEPRAACCGPRSASPSSR